MTCSSCGAENPHGARFCVGCAAELKRACPKCQFENPPQARFCAHCAAPFTDQAAPQRVSRSSLSVPAQEVAEGERKTITALFADIKGSMELTEELDPEESRAIIDPALQIMMEAVRHFGGHVAQSTGDGIFALFGAPIAHEDHPQRALYAALRMQDAMRRYAERLRAEGRAPVEIRVGINTGEVVVRSLRTGEHQVEYVPVGHSISLAARMQAIAPTGAIAVTEHTRKLAEGYFTLKALGPTRVKGLSGPINVYEVTGLGVLRTRLQLSARRGLTRFVGRQAEMNALHQALARAGDGKGQIVAAVGEPGVGKSRLFFEFKARLTSSDTASGWRVLETFSVSHGKATAYLPIVELLNNYFEIAPADDEQRCRERITGKVLTLDRSLEDTLPDLFAILGVSDAIPDSPVAGFVGEDLQLGRRRTMDAIKRLLLRESLRQPLVVIFEDLHWLDDESQTLLNLLVNSIATARILLLVNYRPEYRHDWGSKTYYTQLRLDALRGESAAEMLSSILGDSAELSTLKRIIVERTEGNPFFIEEMIQALVEQGALERNGAVRITRPVNEIRVPPTVQGILAARIDRLSSPNKELLQTMAVIGKEFSLALLIAVLAESDAHLKAGIERLQEGEFIYEQPAVGDIEYMFKHALTQEVAYNSVLIERRKSLHGQIGRAIEERHAERLEDHLSDLAYHYRRSANVRKAVEFLARAANQSMAFGEALEQSKTALALLDSLPNDAERKRLELDLQSLIARLMTVTQGPVGDDVGRALARAGELAAQVGDDSKLVPVLFILRLHHFVRGELEAALKVAERFLDVAQRSGERGALAMAHFALTHTLLQMGEFARAREHAEKGLASYDPEFRLAASIGDIKVACLHGLASSLWALGFPSQALAHSRESVSHGRREARPITLSLAFWNNAFFHHMMGDPVGAHALADAAVAASEEHGLALFEQLGRATRGWAAAMLGNAKGGLADLSAAVERLHTTSRADSRIYTMWAEACGEAGEVERGLSVIEEGLERIERTHERQFEAEHWRVRGELLLMRSGANEDEAQRCFEKAIEVARAQSAKSFELRATISLARLLAKRGKRDEARERLQAIYGWFTEGFETRDLKAARALLDELDSVSS